MRYLSLCVMTRTSVLVLAALLVLSGCASLHMRSTDSPGIKITKGVARVPVAVLTFGMSEA